MIKLAPFEEEDCERLISWVDDAVFLLQWSGPEYAFPLDKDQLLETSMRGRGQAPEHLMFKALDEETGEVIGHIELMHINRQAGTAHIGRVLVGEPDLRGRGFGTEVVSRLVEKAFVSMSLQRLTLTVYESNRPAVACYQGLGFEIREARENSLMVDGESWTTLLMALTSERFYAPKV
jgi:RimJ/RimL family protein N-acetyltransferase